VTSGSCVKSKGRKSLSYTVQDSSTAAEPAFGRSPRWIGVSLSEREAHDHVPGLPFCRTTLFILSLQSTSSPLLRRAAFCFPHDCSGRSFHSDITAGQGDDGRALEVAAAKIQRGGLESLAPSSILFRLQASRSWRCPVRAQGKPPPCRKAAGGTPRATQSSLWRQNVSVTC